MQISCCGINNVHRAQYKYKNGKRQCIPDYISGISISVQYICNITYSGFKIGCRYTVKIDRILYSCHILFAKSGQVKVGISFHIDISPVRKQLISKIQNSLNCIGSIISFLNKFLSDTLSDHILFTPDRSALFGFPFF